jgi:hypothetical protein
MPDFVAHSQADEKHSDMFLDVLGRSVMTSEERKVLNTSKESMEIHRASFGGMATAMAYLSS